MHKVRIGLLGLGQVGSGLVSILNEKEKYFKSTLGVSFEIIQAAVRNPKKKRSVKIGKKILTKNADDVVLHPDVDVVVELMGGTTEARRLVKKALQKGKHVVTANKALLAEHGDEIFKLAHEKGCWILFEASVGGGIPVIKGVREGLAANKIDSIAAIINGTSNYILSRMSEDGLEFETALAEAQAKGYAEADPTFDIDGTDAAHKIAILSRLAFDGSVVFKDIYKEGIAGITSDDIAFAKEFGYSIKLLALAKKCARNQIEARVQPALIRGEHILANVDGSFNAVLLHGDEVGDSLFYGRGAGPAPTASAVLSDLIDIAKDVAPRDGDQSLMMKGLTRKLEVKQMSSILSRYYLRVPVIDQPGVMAAITKILGQYKISISDVIQRERSEGNIVPLIMLTHDTHEKNLVSAVKAINKLKQVKGKTQVIRIEE